MRLLSALFVLATAGLLPQVTATADVKAYVTPAAQALFDIIMAGCGNQLTGGHKQVTVDARQGFVKCCNQHPRLTLCKHGVEPKAAKAGAFKCKPKKAGGHGGRMWRFRVHPKKSTKPKGTKVAGKAGKAVGRSNTGAVRKIYAVIEAACKGGKSGRQLAKLDARDAVVKCCPHRPWIRVCKHGTHTPAGKKLGCKPNPAPKAGKAGRGIMWSLEFHPKHGAGAA